MSTNSSDTVIPVGIGELYATGRPDIALVAYGLGSCIGIALYDPISKVGGMAHVVLPEGAAGTDAGGDAKYADTGVPNLIQKVLSMGAARPRLQAKIAGGARMFEIPEQMAALDIGARNALAVRAALGDAGVPILAEDLGGTNGRTMRFVVGQGKVYLRVPGEDEWEL